MGWIRLETPPCTGHATEDTKVNTAVVKRVQISRYLQKWELFSSVRCGGGVAKSAQRGGQPAGKMVLETCTLIYLMSFKTDDIASVEEHTASDVKNLPL